MMMKIRLLMILVSTIPFAGCATIIHGTHQSVGISSSPPGARISVDGIQGVTPVVMDLTRKDNHIVTMQLEGYEPWSGTLTRSVSGWVWGNLAFGGLIGLGVDGLSGGIYKLEPEAINATLNARAVSR
jgi:hypothetical protein